MKIRYLFLHFLILLKLDISAQEIINTQSSKLNVGIFAPLFLDSAFKGNTYKYDKSFPRFTLQGFDFVQGVKIAMDSFPIKDNPVETYIYDTKSDSLNIKALINNHELDKLNLIIGSVRDEDLTLLADYAKLRQIPFVSATYPNDGGVKSNPYYIVLNSTLKTHCEAIFSYLLQNQDSSKIVFVKKTGTQEDRVQSYFNSINRPEDKPLINIKMLTLDSNYNVIKSVLDSNRKNIVVAGSLDEDFAKYISSALAPLVKKYNLTVIGMPNWETFNSFGKNAKGTLKDFSFLYTSPFYNTKEDIYSNVIQEAYLNNFKGKPSDYTYKGFEVMYVFSRMLNLYPNEINKHWNEIPFKVFSDYNLHNITLQKNSTETDYIENKHLFFLNHVNGVSTKAW